MFGNKCIFVRGYSRSGGTLLVTILDAHPEIAMCYELYPDMLSALHESRIWPKLIVKKRIPRLIRLFDKSDDIKSVAKKIKDRNVRTFFLRCMRGGLKSKDIANLLTQHIDEGHDFSDMRARLMFIERCALTKMEKMKKSMWGLKCSSAFDDYVKMWPNAFFINIVRDGRDVLASQLNTGSFDRNPTKIAREWVETHSRFRSFMKSKAVNACEVFYEELVNKPEEEIKKICDFLKVSFSKSMLKFYEQNLSIYSGPAGHLSLDRISKPIDSSMIGRWTRDVSSSHLDEFYSIAKDLMIEMGYLEDKKC